MSSSTAGNKRRHALLLALLGLGVGAAQPVVAAEAAQTASDLLARARVAYGAERWNEALALYQQLLWESASDSDRREATERMREIDHRLRAAPVKSAEPPAPAVPAPAPPVAAPPRPVMPPGVETPPVVEVPPPALPPVALPGPEAPPPPVSPRRIATVADCLEAFRAGVEPDCTEAREFLKVRGASVLPALRESDRPTLPTSVRAQLTRVYGMLGDASAADILSRRLEDPSPDVRAEACRALGRLGVAAAIPKLRPLLKDGTPGVRERAAEALGRAGDREAVDDLAGMLLDRTGQPSLVRAAAADALGFLDLPASRTALVASLRDPDARVRKAAISGLARLLKGVDRCYDPDASMSEREGAVRAWEVWLAEQTG